MMTSILTIVNVSVLDLDCCESVLDMSMNVWFVPCMYACVIVIFELQYDYG